MRKTRNRLGLYARGAALHLPVGHGQGSGLTCLVRTARVPGASPCQPSSRPVGPRNQFTRTTTSTAANRPTTPSQPQYTTRRWTSWKGVLMPAIQGLRATLDAKAKAFSKVVIVGLTHLQYAL